MRQLDETDIRVLIELQENGRMPNAELAKRINMSPPSALMRMRSLERSGIIQGYRAIIDAEKLGFKIIAWAHISLSLHQDQPIERFRRQVCEFDEVTECYHVSGDYDFLAKVIVKDLKAYEVFVREKLSKIRGVGKINTSFVYGTPKPAGKLPTR